MSKQAVAIVRIDAGTIRKELAAAGGDDRRVGANGESFRIEALDDATLVHLGIGIGSEPDELADRLHALLGEVLEEHDEARGVPVYPSSYALQARTWEAAVEELGEAADWVKIFEEESADDMGGMLSALGLDASDVAELQKQLESPEGGGIFAAALQAARTLTEQGAFGDIAERLQQMGATDPSALAGGLDLEALTQQAQRVLAENPELEEELRRAFEEAGGESAQGGDDDE